MKLSSAPGRVGDVIIEEIEVGALSDDDFARVNAFENVMRAEASPEDPPTPVERTRAGYEIIPDPIGSHEFWATDPDGALAATGEVWWRTTDNRHVARVSIEVRPDGRRRGIGTALFRLCAEAAEAEGCTLLNGTTHERVPAGEAFARRIGAAPGLEEHTNRLVLAGVDGDMVQRWISEGPGRAPGYSLVAIDGPYPDDLIEAIVPVHEIMNTAPRGELAFEDRRYSVHELRRWDERMAAEGTEKWSIFARHDATGELVGFTEVGWNAAQPETVFQWATAVRPDHRGHALGKWLKATMLDRILRERPGVVDVRTGNADSNDAMLGINHGLGFRPYIADTVWQMSTETARAYVTEPSRGEGSGASSERSGDARGAPPPDVTAGSSR